GVLGIAERTGDLTRRRPHTTFGKSGQFGPSQVDIYKGIRYAVPMVGNFKKVVSAASARGHSPLQTLIEKCADDKDDATRDKHYSKEGPRSFVTRGVIKTPDAEDQKKHTRFHLAHAASPALLVDRRLEQRGKHVAPAAKIAERGADEAGHSLVTIV